MSERPVVIVSNRGPVSFRYDDSGRLESRRGAGGLVSGIGPLVAGTDTIWIAAAMSAADRAAAADGVVDAEGFRARLLDIDPEIFRRSYDVVCNATLWFAYHGLWDLPRRPRFDRRWAEAWVSYREVNRLFAEATAEAAPADAVVLVQDYHLALMAPFLAERRPDIAAVHFSHTPFAGPDLMSVLPDAAATELLESMGRFEACGFHSHRWAADFTASAEQLAGFSPTTFVAPLSTDPDDIGSTAASEACTAALADLDATLGDRKLICRVDRIELSKNLLRGFHAYDDLLERHPEWRGRVVFGAFVYPSRDGLPEYLAYRQEVEGLVRRINERWGTDGWTPILYDGTDDYPRSVAAMRRYDVLLVNPIRDGLNLVAKEGPLVNDRDGVLALSRGAGVFDELGSVALPVHPYDVAATADVLHEALSMDPPARAEHASAVRELAAARTPADWFTELVHAATA